MPLELRECLFGKLVRDDTHKQGQIIQVFQKKKKSVDNVLV